MDDDIEDMVGDVKYTDSQKSIMTSSNLYSLDFTDSSSRSSEKNNSSGKETYVIESDSEDSEQTFPLHDCVSAMGNDVKELALAPSVQCGSNIIHSKSASTNFRRCSIIAQEIYTQTSKTIIELAETEANMKRPVDSKNLQTQTSFMSITENKTVEYRIEVSSAHDHYAKTDFIVDESEPLQKKTTYFNVQYTEDSMGEESSKFPVSETENDEVTFDNASECSSVLKIIDDDSDDTLHSDENNKQRRVDDLSEYESEVEEDSLLTEAQKRPNDDVKELREKLSENMEVCLPERYEDTDMRRFGTLTPLTEESNVKKDSLMDITPINNIVEENKVKDEVLFTNNAGMKVKLMKDEEVPKASFRLPPIQNHSCPNSPHLNSLFGKTKLNKAGTLPSVYERHSKEDRWEIATKTLASGESPLINGRNQSPRKIQLPPIQGEVPAIVNRIARATSPPRINCSPPTDTGTSEDLDSINIKDKIKELKLSSKQLNWTHKKPDSRSGSPGSACSRDEPRLSDVADRGCETLCVELLRRLRAGSWFEIVETLEEIPRVLDKFWDVITEQRIADLVRVVNTLVESPRPQVARTACTTVAAILKNTNYTKKPDFYEAITILLTKTGSYSRAVRRAANVALDEVVCGVDLTQAVTALCMHGVGHKNALVRCASARLLVVCCALSGGGRDLLRTRPPTAAGARKHALRALAALLDDKSTDTRKYAERLYQMLRPLSNFEAYYLTDVDVEVASKQMKKYDQLLCNPKETR